MLIAIPPLVKFCIINDVEDSVERICLQLWMQKDDDEQLATTEEKKRKKEHPLNTSLGIPGSIFI